jgi:uncharacterized protein (TIGR02246 family)
VDTISSAEEEAIYREIEAFGEAWNRGDPEAAASFFTEDAVRVGAFGDIQRGRAEIETAFDRLLHGTMAGATVRQEGGWIRMLTPDLAVWQGGLEITPVGGPSMKGHVVQVMRRVQAEIGGMPSVGPWGLVADATGQWGKRWLIVEAHPRFFPPRS